MLAATDPLDSLKAQGGKIVTPFVKNIRQVAECFDVCVMDTSPDQNFVNLSALISSTHVLSPLNLGDYSIDGVKKLLQTIVGVKQKYNEGLEFIGLLPNLFIRNQPNQVAALKGLLETYSPTYMFLGTIGHRSSFETTVTEKRPIWLDKKTSAREATKEMAAVLTAIENRMGM